MKCKNHTSSDATGSGAVCAVCLRDRLLAVLAAQTAASSPDHHRRSPAASTSDPRVFHTPQAGDRVGYRRFSLLSSLFHHRHHQESEPSRRKEKKKSVSVSVSDRGMSPVQHEDDSETSGYTTDSSSTTWQQRPTPARQGRRQFIGGLAGWRVCLSPLMRPAGGPARKQASDLVGFSGEIRSGLNPVFSNSNQRHVAGGGSLSFGPNRSRKLADRGRFR